MTAPDVGRTRFQDGMRVAREHLEHLQDVALAGASHARETAGLGKVAWGFRVEPKGPTTVTVGPGLAVDPQGRPLALQASRDVAVDLGGAPAFLVLTYLLRADGLVEGVPTLLSDDLTIEVRTAAPPYQDDGVVFARLDQAGDAIRATQLGDWYLPALDHGHGGTFLLRQGRWRYDGHPVGFPGPLFDSGFIPVEANGEVRLTYGLKTADLVVQLQARRPDGIVTTAGLGQSFWYELVGDQEIRLLRFDPPDAAGLELRVSIWRLGQAAAGPVLPVADAGAAQVVEAGRSFTLDAGTSRAFGGRTIVKYVWTELT